jgi:hypothetical protein
MPAPDPPLALPVTLDWYRQAANWLVGLSTAAIGAGFSVAGKVRAQTVPIRIVFLASGFAFLVAVLGGVFFYLWITNYANQLEQRAARLPETPANTVQAQDAALATASKRYTFFYELLLWSFPAAVLLVAVDVILVVCQPPGQPEIALVAGAIAHDRGTPQEGAVLLKDGSGTVWILSRDDSGKTVWRGIGFDPVPASHPPRQGEALSH